MRSGRTPKIYHQHVPRELRTDFFFFNVLFNAHHQLCISAVVGRQVFASSRADSVENPHPTYLLGMCGFASFELVGFAERMTKNRRRIQVKEKRQLA